MEELTIYAGFAAGTTWTNVANATGNTPTTSASCVGTRNQDKTLVLSQFSSDALPEDAIITQVAVTLRSSVSANNNGNYTATSPFGNLNLTKATSAHDDVTVFTPDTPYSKSNIDSFTVSVTNRRTTLFSGFTTYLYLCSLKVTYEVPKPTFKIYYGDEVVEVSYFSDGVSDKFYYGDIQI